MGGVIFDKAQTELYVEDDDGASSGTGEGSEPQQDDGEGGTEPADPDEE